MLPSVCGHCLSKAMRQQMIESHWIEVLSKHKLHNDQQEIANFSL